MTNALMIFVDNPEKGKVKSMLAKEIGEDRTLQVYHYLLQYTRDVCLAANCSHFVFYSSYIHVNDVFDDDCFTKFVQEGEDQGARMINAFRKVFALGCKNVCVISTNCIELETEIIDDAFKRLTSNDIVLGPARDGEYYLLGMKELHLQLFTQMKWESSRVLDDTIDTITKLNLSFSQLKVLNKIDTLNDLLDTNILTRLEEDELEK